MKVEPIKTGDPRYDYARRDADGRTKAVRLIEAGAFIPQGARVLLRALNERHSSDMASDDLDANAALCYEVLALGTGCAAWADEQGIPEDQRIQVGDHCQATLEVIDRANKCSASTAYYTAPLRHIDGFWRPDAGSADPDASASRA